MSAFIPQFKSFGEKRNHNWLKFVSLCSERPELLDGIFFFLFGNDTPFLTRRHPAPDPKWRSVRMNKKMSDGVRARDGPSAPARGGVWGWGCQSVGGRGELLLGWRSVSDRRWSPHLPRSVRPAPPGCDAPLPAYAPVIPGQGASSRPVPKTPRRF